MSILVSKLGFFQLEPNCGYRYFTWVNTVLHFDGETFYQSNGFGMRPEGFLAVVKHDDGFYAQYGKWIKVE